MHDSDVLAMALRLPREGFVAQYPFPLLVGDTAFNRRGVRLETRELTAVKFEEPTAVGAQRLPPEPLLSSVVCPVRKIIRSQPDRISVGRRDSNDIVLLDDSVSKAHAYFVLVPGQGLGLVDQGSMNGTWVGEQQLTKNAQAVPVAPGTRVHFGRVALTLVDSGAFWDRLH